MHITIQIASIALLTGLGCLAVITTTLSWMIIKPFSITLNSVFELKGE
ncbi:hypothetical protein [Hahella ganghwensis]|nr:hypothetical protein [Hahella ganghwensis]